MSKKHLLGSGRAASDKGKAPEPFTFGTPISNYIPTMWATDVLEGLRFQSGTILDLPPGNQLTPFIPKPDEPFVLEAPY